MPVIKYTVEGPQFLLPGALPVNFSLEFPSIGFGGLPSIPVEIGTGPFDIGIEVEFVCPGYPFCQASQACRLTKGPYVWQLDPQQLISIKIPGIPEFPIIPKIPTINLSIPPKFMLPLNCPNYVRQQQEAADAGPTS
jgi:hypothetical protein